MAKYLDERGLVYFWSKIKKYIDEKLNVSETKASTAIKGNSQIINDEMTLLRNQLLQFKQEMISNFDSKVTEMKELLDKKVSSIDDFKHKTEENTGKIDRVTSELGTNTNNINKLTEKLKKKGFDFDSDDPSIEEDGSGSDDKILNPNTINNINDIERIKKLFTNINDILSSKIYPNILDINIEDEDKTLKVDKKYKH